MLIEPSKIPFDSVLHEILVFPCTANPFTRKAKRSFRFSVPDEWYRRPGISKGTDESKETNDAHDPSQSNENDSEGEGTAKAVTQSKTEASSSSGTGNRGSLSQNRLSSMFTGLLQPTSPTTSFTPDNAVATSSKRMTVSEPVLLEQHTGGSIKSVGESSLTHVDIDPNAFEAMLVCTDLVLSREI